MSFGGKICQRFYGCEIWHRDRFFSRLKENVRLNLRKKIFFLKSLDKNLKGSFVYLIYPLLVKSFLPAFSKKISSYAKKRVILSFVAVDAFFASHKKVLWRSASLFLLDEYSKDLKRLLV